MYIYIHVCGMYTIYIYVCIYSYTHGCAVCVSINMYVYVCLHTHLCMCTLCYGVVSSLTEEGTKPRETEVGVELWFGDQNPNEKHAGCHHQGPCVWSELLQIPEWLTRTN